MITGPYPFSVCVNASPLVPGTETMARYDDLDTTAIAYTTFVSTIILVVIILLGRALAYGWIELEDQKKLERTRYISSDNAISEQLEQLDGYKKVKLEVSEGAESGTADAAAAATEERVRIPIEKAREILLKELSGQPSA